MWTAIQNISYGISGHAYIGGTFCQSDGTIGGALAVDVGFHAAQIRVQRECHGVGLRANIRLKFARICGAGGGPLRHIAKTGEMGDALHGHFVGGHGCVPFVGGLHFKIAGNFCGNTAGIKKIRAQRGGHGSIHGKWAGEVKARVFSENCFIHAADI